MEKLNSKKPVRVNGYIVSVQSQNMAPIQSYVKEASEIGSFVSSILNDRPGAIVFISASVIL